MKKKKEKNKIAPDINISIDIEDPELVFDIKLTEVKERKADVIILKKDKQKNKSLF